MGTYSTSERTRQALINAAGELIVERGVGRVSTRAIAQKAGENLGTIHYHFGGKEELFKEVLRFACKKPAEASLPEVIQAYENRLDGREVREEAVREVIRHFVKNIFCTDRPQWCSRVVYHVLQHAGPLRDYLLEEVINPFFAALSNLVRAIRPDWALEDVYLWIHVTIGASVFHSDHAEIILERFGTDTFPASYLAKLEQRLVCDALRALGLPANDSTPEQQL